MSLNKYPSDPILETELKLLNEAVEAAIKARSDWMDAHMADYSKVKVGEMLYNVSSGCPLGVVAELYRYWGNGRDWKYDTSMTIDAHYQPIGSGGNIYDNTSRQVGVNFGSQDEAYAIIKRRADSLAPTAPVPP